MEPFNSFMNSPQQIEVLAMERQSWIKATPEFRDQTMRILARKMMNINKNDPFIYSRVMSSLKNNMTTPADYEKRK